MEKDKAKKKRGETGIKNIKKKCELIHHNRYFFN